MRGGCWDRLGGTRYLDWAGEAVCRFEFYKSLFSLLNFD